MFELISKGFVLGLSLGTSCIVTCGPVLLPFLLRDEKSLRRGFAQTLLFLSGRLLGYLLFGLIAGALGMSIPTNLRFILAYSAYILLGSLLLYHAIRQFEQKLCPAEGMNKAIRNPAILGFLTGINVCPPFALAIGSAFETGGPIGGMILFGGFFFGSAVWFIPFAFFSGISLYKGVRIVARIIAGLVGLYFILQGASGLILYTQDSQRVMYQQADFGQEEIMSFSEFDTLFFVGEDSLLLAQADSVFTARLRRGTLNIIHLPALDTTKLYSGSAVLLFSLQPADNLTRELAIGSNLYIVNVVIDTTYSLNRLEILADMLEHYYFRKTDDQGFFFITEPRYD